MTMLMPVLMMMFRIRRTPIACNMQHELTLNVGMMSI